MKKGQVTPIIVFLLIIITIALVLIAYILIADRQTPTSGRVIEIRDFYESSEPLRNEPSEPVGKYVTGNVVVNPPFYISAANAKKTGITLAIKNNGGEDYEISSLSISNCGKITPSRDIENEETITLKVPCNIGTEIFRGDITITYRKMGIAVDLTSTGTMAQTLQ